MNCQIWRLRTGELSFSEMPLIMGIVNVTPDSFSDGGQFFTEKKSAPNAAVRHALALEAAGAAILDIGGESTRPGAEPVSVDEELQRVIPVIEKLAKQTKKPISIDTSKARVAQKAIAAGAEIVNDVTGLEADEAMIKVVAETNVGVCVMHSQGRPQTMQKDPRYGNVVEEVKSYLAARRDVLLSAGVQQERICLDPGIGFGKTTEHNLQLMRSISEFHELNCPLLVGHSRKRFLGEILGNRETDRTAATIGSSIALAANQVPLIRVHDVKPVYEALKAFQACGGAS